MEQMCVAKHRWVTLGSGTHNLIQHSTHDTNHVHRIHPLPFTGLPIMVPLSVLSTCCPSLERGSLRRMRMVWHAFTMQLKVVASQWWGTSWTSVDLTSARELEWVVDWKMTLCVYTNTWLFCKAWCISLFRRDRRDRITHSHKHAYNDTHTHVRSLLYSHMYTPACIEGQHHQCGWRRLSWQCRAPCGSAPCGTMYHYIAALPHSPTLTGSYVYTLYSKSYMIVVFFCPYNYT